jgi:broad specificity phosphatase PhoE
MAESSLTLVRHGQTEWSQNGRHTSRTDLPLLAQGRERAAGLRQALDPSDFTLALCSPRERATETARLAGFATQIELTDDLVEWDYGDYEGLTTPEIRGRRPDWDMWRDGCPGGESPEQVRVRVDRVIERGARHGGAVILFAHGHLLRALTARWLEQEVAFGARLVLAPATVSRLGTVQSERVLECWNMVVG